MLARVLHPIMFLYPHGTIDALQPEHIYQTGLWQLYDIFKCSATTADHYVKILRVAAFLRQVVLCFFQKNAPY